MSTHDTWILVSIPTRRTSQGIAVRVGLGLLAWAERHRDRHRRTIELCRVARPVTAQRPFC